MKAQGIRWLVAFLLFSVHAFSSVAQTLSVSYAGAWTNLTFGSTGAARIQASIDGPSAMMNFDLDGFVFGSFDPPVMALSGTVQNGELTFDQKGLAGLGDISGTVNLISGATVITLTNVPNPSIRNVQLTGTISTNVNLEYVVDFTGAPSVTNPARGVLIAALVAPLRVTAISTAGGQIQLSWEGGNPPFQVQTSGQLSPADWQNAGAPVNERSGAIGIPASGRLFIRVRGQ